MLDLAPFLRIDGWISLLTLTALEVVLGIDNLVFLSIMTGKLPPDRQPLARRLGLGLALVMRVLLLLAMSWLVTLQTDLFTALRARGSAGATSSSSAAGCSWWGRRPTRSSTGWRSTTRRRGGRCGCRSARW